MASRRSLELAGVRFIEIVNVPEDCVIDQTGHTQKCRYRLEGIEAVAIRYPGALMRITAILFLTFSISLPSFAAEHTRWVGTWAASPSPQLPDESKMRAANLEFENQTLREIVHTSIGGNTVRVRLSNAYGKDTVEIGAAHIALHSKDDSIVAGSDHALTFGGQTSISIPPNAPVLSDPVQLNVPASGDLVVSVFLPKATAGAGIHYGAQQTAYIGAGNVTGAHSNSRLNQDHVVGVLERCRRTGSGACGGRRGLRGFHHGRGPVHCSTRMLAGPTSSPIDCFKVAPRKQNWGFWTPASEEIAYCMTRLPRISDSV